MSQAWIHQRVEIANTECRKCPHKTKNSPSQLHCSVLVTYYSAIMYSNHTNTGTGVALPFADAL